MIDLLKKIFGSKNDREIKRLRGYISRVNDLESSMKSLKDEDFPRKTAEFKQRIANGQTLDSILPEAFALCREAAFRVRGERHYDVQLIGGAALHEGRISEMKTGEGKTLTATSPVYLNALSGKGVHVVTVNDYLAQRDAENMGKLYAFLGLTTGIIVHGLTDQQRRASYAADITYGTNNEFGFDFLRDNMKTDKARFVQRGHNFAIVDEVDSILIDEARTPLIISGPAESNLEYFYKVNTAIPGLQKDVDYIVDEKSRVVSLTEDGINKLEKRLRVENLYDPRNIDYLHHVQQALKAHVIFKKDVDYVVREGKVLIVDEFTGRLMPGRRYSDGLHGALEAKEHVEVQNETQTMATITFQNYFRMYSKLAGMTGTADTEAVEFKKIYNLEVTCIPTNKKMIREDAQDEVYRTAREKFNVIAEEIAKAQAKGQPVLVGTVSVEKSELLASLLKKKNIPHEILNAKNHAREADIIKNAGQLGRVTISTNMAGRGTDIILGEGVAAAGGLYVIGTERHESRRIDNQLRGRSGRQGDPGASKFFLSLEDDLMRIFASDRLSAIMERLGMKEGESIVSPMVTRAIERAQRRVEEQNFSSRKHLLEYDDVMNQQRQVVYGQRNQALNFDDGHEIDFIDETIEKLSHGIVTAHSTDGKDGVNIKVEDVVAQAKADLNCAVNLSGVNTNGVSVEELTKVISDQVKAVYQDKFNEIGKENLARLEGYVYLQVIDRAWKNHLQGMDHLRDSVSLRGYGQRDPLQEYKREAFRLFEAMMNRITDETTQALLHMEAPRITAASQAQMQSQMQADEPDEEELVFRHPTAPAAQASPAPSPSQQNPAGGGGQGRAAQPSDDGMIYHGSRTDMQANQRQQQQTVRRQEPKTGRNDPCPCGSGKKYKKCHGSLEA
jgi:preprotein translocase subunit SecA